MIDSRYCVADSDANNLGNWQSLQLDGKLNEGRNCCWHKVVVPAV
ncbi:hypothetical protein W04_1475 [Pseudoalteromonas sp. SW0106-04]|nr:hypothetical protein W04_1475 [Pseudoalteromonas sp. SW0106-04]